MEDPGSRRMLPPEQRSGYVPEWEYEYDENETEDLYFTLDLPDAGSTFPSAAKRRKYNDYKNHAARAQQASEALLEGTDSATRVTDATVDVAGGRHPTEPSKVAIGFLDLHSSNPRVRYESTDYQCQWSTDLGTQFIVSQSGVVEQPLRNGFAVDVVALSRTRLTGQYAPHPAAKASAAKDAPGTGDGASVNNAIVLDGDNIETPKERQSPQRPAIKANTQSSFLQRLAEIQRRKDNASKELAKGSTQDAPRQSSVDADPPQQRGDLTSKTPSLPVSPIVADSESRPMVNLDPLQTSAQSLPPDNTPSAEAPGTHGPTADEEVDTNATIQLQNDVALGQTS